MGVIWGVLGGIYIWDLHWYQADTHGIRWVAPLIDRRVDLMVTHRLLEGLAEAGNTLARVLFEVSKVCWHNAT